MFVSVCGFGVMVQLRASCVPSRVDNVDEMFHRPPSGMGVQLSLCWDPFPEQEAHTFGLQDVVVSVVVRLERVKLWMRRR